MSRVSAFVEGQRKGVQLLKRKLHVVILGFKYNFFIYAYFTLLADSENCHPCRGQLTSSSILLEELFDFHMVKEFALMGGS